MQLSMLVPGEKFLPSLPERDERQAQPLFCDGVPARRLRSKTAPPPAIATMSMLHIEGGEAHPCKVWQCV